MGIRGPTWMENPVSRSMTADSVVSGLPSISQPRRGSPTMSSLSAIGILHSNENTKYYIDLVPITSGCCRGVGVRLIATWTQECIQTYTDHILHFPAHYVILKT